jgi:hypothetical protein
MREPKTNRAKRVIGVTDPRSSLSIKQSYYEKLMKISVKEARPMARIVEDLIEERFTNEQL